MKWIAFWTLIFILGWAAGKGLIAANMYPESWISDDIIIDSR